MRNYIFNLEERVEDYQIKITKLESLLNCYEKVEFIATVWTMKNSTNKIKMINLCLSFSGMPGSNLIASLKKQHNKYEWIFLNKVGVSYTVNIQDCVTVKDYIGFMMKALALGEIPYTINII